MTDWKGCYKGGWGKELVPEAFSHPAKVARGLAKRIYQHAIDEGWLEEGMTVIDPFAGIGGFAYHALQHELEFVGVELEQKFVDLGNQNIDLWNSRYAGRLRKWGSAIIIQGDSRRMAKVLRGEVSGCVSSPPYIKSMSSEKHGIDFTKSKKDYPGRKIHAERLAMQNRHHEERRYGSHPANLGNMPAGQLDAAISSPPYVGSAVSSDGQRGIDTGDEDATTKKRRQQRDAIPDGYGHTEGQLAAMPVDGVVSSLPYEEGLGHGMRKVRQIDIDKKLSMAPGSLAYGESDGQLGQKKGHTFWSAARQIVQQVYQVLAPGAPAIWVAKSFIRKGRLVNFPEQWRQLCESCGFETVHEHRAWLVEDSGTQTGFFGNKEIIVERKSFFRRLYEFNAQATKFWEPISRRDKAICLWTAHHRVWEKYQSDVADGKDNVVYPSRTKIMGNAKAIAYVEAGKPRVDIDTRIDFEVVLCMRKA